MEEREQYWKPRKTKDRLSANIMDFNKRVASKNKCERCQTTMKNPRKYNMGKTIIADSGRWTVVKTCKRCGLDNIAEMR